MGVWHLLVVEVLVPRLCLAAKLRGTQPPEDLEAVPAIPKYREVLLIRSISFKRAGLVVPVLAVPSLIFSQPHCIKPAGRSQELICNV